MGYLAKCRFKSLWLLPLLLLSVTISVLPFRPVFGNTAWSSPLLTDSNNGRNQLSTSLQASNGTLWIAWQSSRNAIMTGRYDILYKTYTNGVWSVSRNMTTSGQNASPWLIQLPNGTIGMFWSLKPANSYEIFYTHYVGSGWSTPVRITSTSFNDTQPSAAVGHDGRVWLVWTRVNSTNTSYKMGATWSSETQLTNTSTSVDSYMPSAAQSSYGTKSLWLFYSSNLNEPTYDIYALMSSGISPVQDVDLSAIHASNNLGTFWEYPGGLKSIGQSAIVTVSITVANLGDYGESISLSLTATNKTSTSLGTKTSFVGPGASVIVYYYWNTSGIKPARYGFSATVTPVPGEAYGNTFDNTLNLSNQTRIIPLGDVNQDGSIDIIDAGVCLAHFGWKDSSYYLLKYSDVDNAGYIDIIDVGVVEVNFGFVS